MSRKSYVIIALIILFFVVMLFDKFLSHRVKRILTPKEKYIKTRKQLNLRQHEKIDQFVDSNPSSPVSFGYKIVWLALKTTDSNAVLKLLNNKNDIVFQTNWQKGVEGAYEGYCFISPPVDDWTLVLNPNLENLSNKDTRDFLKLLSNEFGEVQFFASHRIVSHAAWGRFIDGEMIRAFSIADGHIDMDAGDLTIIEEKYIEEEKKAMSIDDHNYYEVEGFHNILSGEDLVMEVAGLWSINPQNLDKYETSKLGLIVEDI